MKATPFTILLLFALLSALGFLAAPRLAVKLQPSYMQPILHVGCSWRGANAETIERQVTSVLEGSLNAIKGIKSIKSTTKTGGCSVQLNFDKNADIHQLRYEAAAIIRHVYPGLPLQVSYPYLTVRGQSTEQQPFMVYSMLTVLPKEEIQELSNKELIPQLTEIAGVHGAGIYGANGKQWHIIFDREKMRSLDLTIKELELVIRGVNTWSNLGVLADGKKHMVLTSQEQDNWEDLPIKALENKIIRLGDVASVSLEDMKATSHYRLNGLSTITLSVTPMEGANQIELSKKIKALIAETETNWQAHTSFVLRKDNSEQIQTEIEKIINRSSLTLFILFVFIWLAAPNIRYLLIIICCLTANISLSFLAYYFLGIELHLYSFAGMTVSLGIIIDNSLVMVDHLRHKQNRKVFRALLASTLTTIGSLSMIFFLSERLILNMMDFALVIIINLSVSLFVALFLVPALLTKIPLTKTKGIRTKRKRKIIWFDRGYSNVIRWMTRTKWVYFLLIILIFGLPIYLLPTRLGDRNRKKGLSSWEQLYNSTLGSDFYNENLRTPLNIGLGGTLRLFTEKVNHSKYFQNKERTNLMMRAQMPVGARLEHMNEAFKAIENYLEQFKEIDQFETNIWSAENAQMNITFKEEHEFGSFPFILKDLLIKKAIKVGSADWQVYGLGDGFNNSTREQIGSYQVDLYGYNYEQLYQYARALQETLLINPRVQVVNIMGRNKRFREKNYQYVLEQDDELIALNKDHFSLIYKEMQLFAMSRDRQVKVTIGEKRHQVYLSSSDEPNFNLWNLNHQLFETSNAKYRISEMSVIGKRRIPEEISRFNQQYYLKMEYYFIGSPLLGHRFHGETIADFKKKLPMGYTADEVSRQLRKKEKNEQIYMILLVIMIIYFICAILFESLIQPLAVISLIPMTFIGVFLSFYLLEFNFDQGGFAAFVLLSGLTVNSALFIINDMNNLRRQYKHLNNQLKWRTYRKAFHGKIIPILLAILSTIVGLSPYLFLGQEETFWFPLAVGTSGGLIFSLVVIYLYLPLFFVPKIKKINT